MAREMKDSGVEWIGQIPIEWETRNIKNMFSFGKGLSITKENLKEQGIAVISYGQIHSKLNRFYEISDGLIRFVDESYLETDEQSLVNRGDFIFADTSEDVEGCGNFIYVDEQQTLFAGYHTIILRSLTQKDNRFLAFLFMSDCWRKQIRECVNGVKLFSISQKLIKRTNILIPPEEERVRIVNHLEDQCNTVDNVQKKIRASIEEYKKLKQAVITQTVTQGIRGNREMKDSGIECIGGIPLTWNQCKLKNVSVRIGDGLHGTPEFDDNGNVYFINGNNIGEKYLEIKNGTKRLSEDELMKFPVPTLNDNSIMIALNGTYGKVSLYKKSPVLLGKSAGYITLIETVCREYIRYYLMGSTSKLVMALSLNGTTIPNLSLATLNNFPTLLPPIEEQWEIAQYLDSKVDEIDALIMKKERYLLEIENYKKSLIYEYVTGKKEVPQDYQA